MTLLHKIDHYKSTIDEMQLFESDLLNDIKAYYRIVFTWSSNALEGNTLTKSETKVLLEDGLTVLFRCSFSALYSAIILHQTSD
jgi:hypothetical protein